MAELPPDTSAAREGETTPGTPRWLEVLGIIVLAAVVLVVVLILTGRGGGHGPGRHGAAGDAGPVSGSSMTAMGPGLSVSDALASKLPGPLLINGYLLAGGGIVRLCEALRESSPPQCGGASLAVQGLDLGAREDLREQQGTRWSPNPVQLLGHVEGGVLRVDKRSSA
jgi:hypothetical protein